MGYAAVGGSAASSNVAEEEGFRASIIRKRHSLFGSRAAESTSSLSLHTTTPAPAPAEHHNAQEATTGDSRRRSFFGGRFAFGTKKEEQPRTRDTSPPKLDPMRVQQHLRGFSVPADVSLTEDNYYRNHTKSTISPPFHFQHVTHTKKKHLPALDSVDEKILNKEFVATSTSQVPKRHLQGIQAEDLSVNPEAMGLIRGSVDKPPARTEKTKSAAPSAKAARSSRYEDITALPDISKPKRSLSTKTRRDEWGSLLGFSEKGKSSSTESQGLTKARADTYNALLGIREDTETSESKAEVSNLSGFPILSQKQSADSSTPRNDMGSILGFTTLTQKQSADSTRPAPAEDASTSLGYSPLTPKQSADPPKPPPKDDMGSLLGFSTLTQKHTVQSLDSARPTRPSMDENKRLSSLGRGQKTEHSLSRGVSSLLRFKDRSMSESAVASPRAKREEVNALLGIAEEKPKRQSKQPIDEKKQDEINALLGLPKVKSKKFEPMAPPAPPRPRRSDEELKIRNQIVPSAPSPLLPPPDRPRRDSKDVQHLRDMGFGQLLYRANSNESRQGHTLGRELTNESRPSLTLQRQNSTSSQQAQQMRRETSNDTRSGQAMARQSSNDSRLGYPLLRHDSNTLGQPSPRHDSHSFAPALHRQDSNTSRHTPTSPYSPRFPTEEEAPSPVGGPEDFARAQQVVYRSRQPLPPLPRVTNISPEGRSPLQTVSELGETYTPLRTPTDSAISPRSPNYARSPSKITRSPELTGPSIPDDDRWEREIDFLYSKQMEATNDFDWDNVSVMTPHRLSKLSVREPEKRLSLNMPSETTLGAGRLSKKFSEGSLRSSIYMPAALNIQPQHRVYAAKQMSPVDEYSSGMSRASPEIRVMDVNDHRQEVSYPVVALHMHGYESIAAGYLSDPESNSERSQHRKSNSYSSWESRPSVAKEAARYSNASINNVPELTYTRRPKQPITSIPGYNSPQELQTSNPMHDYTAFTKGPYAQYDASPTEYVSVRRPESISQSALLRVAAARSSRDQAQLESQKWSRGASNSPTSPYPQEQHSGWI
ncbi:hypothetical protein AMS68_003871 [Peltaster fructicola]|uniref:CRIB domain-containing protein n=1 Tax=Peltaster fructicola TaxID=286661 RepID=A0A6H0XUE5_9PEZI|nr:hypothetical protein AMS68_003871 [Peltaster fructicola]